MISKRIFCDPAHDNYKRLALYIANGGKEHERSYTRKPYLEGHGYHSLTQNRLRPLSQCRLAHNSQQQERTSPSLLSFDARPDRRLSDLMRRQNNDSKIEKCLLRWSAGCWSGDDYELAIQEVMDTQALNTRSNKEKTYHMIVSFHPEDESKLTPEVFKAIEERFAKALGLEEHQRHCGVHGNTDHIHMHVAYNLIHPERLCRVEPWKDFIKRDKL